MNNEIDTNKISKIIAQTSKAIESQAKKKYDLSEKLIKNEQIDFKDLQTAVENHYLFSDHTKQVCEKLLELCDKKDSETIHILETIINRLNIINNNLKMQVASLKNKNTRAYLLLYKTEKENNKTTINNYSKKLTKFNIIIPKKTFMIATLVILSLIGQINQSFAYENPKKDKTELLTKLISLGAGEYSIPDNVMKAYAGGVGTGSLLGVPNGLRIQEDYLKYGQRRGFFRDAMQKEGYSEEETKKWEKIFSTEGNILIKQSIVGTELGNITLRHERIHKLLKTIRPESRQQLQAIANEMLDLMNEGYVPGTTREFQIAYTGMRAAQRNWEEFYTYFIQGDFDQRIDTILKERYPSVHNFVKHLEKEASKNLEF